MYGQSLHCFPHLCVPVLVHDGLDFVAKFALTNMDLRFGGCWKASMGGSAKIFFRVGSCVIVFQWVFMMDETLVKQG